MDILADLVVETFEYPLANFSSAAIIFLGPLGYFGRLGGGACLVPAVRFPGLCVQRVAVLLAGFADPD